MSANPYLFGIGNKGGPGRPKGSLCGRAKALAMLDQLIGDEKNLEILKAKLQKTFTKDPVKFFKMFVMPLIPKESLSDMEVSEKAPVRLIFTSRPNEEKAVG